MSGNEGGGFDFNRLAQQMGLGMGGGNNATQGADAPVKNFDELIERILDLAAKWAGRLVNVKSDSILSTGVTANADITKAGIQVNNQMMRQSFDVNGGVVANSLFEGMQIASVKDFSKVTPPGGGEAATGSASFSDLVGAQGSMGSFAWADVPAMPEGGFRPSAAGAGMDTGHQIG